MPTHFDDPIFVLLITERESEKLIHEYELLESEGYPINLSMSCAIYEVLGREVSDLVEEQDDVDFVEVFLPTHVDANGDLLCKVIA